MRKKHSKPVARRKHLVYTGKHPEALRQSMAVDSRTRVVVVSR